MIAIQRGEVAARGERGVQCGRRCRRSRKAHRTLMKDLNMPDCLTSFLSFDAAQPMEQRWAGGSSFMRSMVAHARMSCAFQRHHQSKAGKCEGLSWSTKCAFVQHRSAVVRSMLHAQAAAIAAHVRGWLRRRGAKELRRANSAPCRRVALAWGWCQGVCGACHGP